MTELQTRLFALRDDTYRVRRARVLPGVPYARVIGVRAPALRAIAKEMAGTPEAAAFLAAPAHEYHEESMLHAYLVSMERDVDRCLALVDAFLPHVDNWEVCDAILPHRAFRACPPALMDAVKAWLHSGACYTVRYGIGALMRYYLGEKYSPECAALVASVRSEEYYVHMMVAWYFASALAVRYDDVLPYLTERKLPRWTHNKAIQKAVESFCVPQETKTYLKTLRY